ncbi:amino acid ABC transporter permease [Variovorax paradoxus]|nr:amino acid ABC transporter permease [Variovorax paradoxus]MBT2302273.1 amino acid ABC transporter permease [Variovorax paradoxus]
MTGTAFNANHLLFLLQGAGWTAILSLIAFVGGGLCAFIVALARVSPHRWVRAATGLWVQLVQGSPLLVIMFLAFFGLPTLGIKVSALAAAGVSLTIYVSAYLGEIWRGAIQAVPRAQWEAAECLALSRTQRMFKVVLPQAVRLATPPTVGFMVQIVKNTSLASVVGFVELARSGQIINNSIFEPFIVYLVIAAIYFALCYPLSVWSRRLERRAAASPTAAKAVFTHEPVLAQS